MKNKNKILIFLTVLLLLMSAKNTYSQNNTTDTLYIDKLIDSSLIFIDSNLKLSFYYLNKALNLSSESEYQDGLIKIYSIFSDIFVKREKTDKAQKFLLQKYTLLKKKIKENPESTSFKNELTTFIKQIALTYEKQGDVNIAIEFYREGVKISNEINDYIGLIEFYSLIGRCYQFEEEYDNAMKYYEKSMNMSIKIDDQNLICSTYMFISSLYYNKNDIHNALFNYFEALTIAHKYENNKYISLCYISISKIFCDLQLYDKALFYNKKSFPVNKNIENSHTIGISYTRQADIHCKIGDYEKALEFYEKSIVFLSEDEHQRWLANTYNGMGLVHLKFSQEKLALEKIIMGLTIRKHTYRQKDITKSYITLGNYYIYTENYDEAKKYLIKAIKIAEEIGNQLFIKEAYEYLATIYENEKNYELAVKYKNLSKNIINNYTMEENILKIVNTETDFYYKLEQANNIKLNLETKKFHQLLYISIISLSVSLIVLTIIFIFLLVSRKKLLLQHEKNKYQNKLIKEQYVKYKKLSIVASQTDNAILISDKNGKIEWVNDGFERKFKQNLASLQEKNVDNIKNISNNIDINKTINFCINNKKTVKYEEKYTFEEKVSWVQTTITPVLENNEIIKLIAIDADITDLKIAEERIDIQKRELENQTNLLELYNSELKVQQVAVGESNEELRKKHEELELNADMLITANDELKKLSIIASETNNSIYLFDATGNIIWGNGAFERHTGYSYEEFIENIGDNLITISSNPDIENIYIELIETQKPTIYTSQFETRKGKIIWLQTSLTPIIAEGKITQIIALDTNITEIKEAEEKIFVQNKEIKSSIHYASRIQKALLPMPLFVSAVFENYFILNKPRDIVSGDFFWVAHKNGKSIAVLADCTGHGIPGAFMSVLGMMSFNSVINNLENVKADEILNLMKNRIISLLHQRGKTGEANDGMDASVCIFDFENNTLEYSGANSAVYFVRKNKGSTLVKTKRIKPDKISIDYNPLRGDVFKSHFLNLKKGDCIYMSSDGYIDQFGGINEKKFLRANFEILLQNIHEEPIKEQKIILNNTIEAWRGNIPQIDDILVFGIQV